MTSMFPGPGSPSGVGNDTLQAHIIAAWVVMTTMAVITVGLRLYTRCVIRPVLGPDDWLILVAVIFNIGTCIGFVRQSFFALGRHAWTVTPEMLHQWEMEQWYSFFFYTLSLSFTKLAIVVLYFRILLHGRLRVANYVVLAFVIACNVWVFISQFVQCIPLRSIWDPAVPGKCIGLAVPLGNSILHIITDFIIIALPLPALVKLSMNPRRKIGLMIVFSLGFFVCVISILRIATIKSVDFNDMTYSFTPLAYWGAVEINLAVICACLTTLKPLVDRLFPTLLGSSPAGSAEPGPIDTIGMRRVRSKSTQEHSFARSHDGRSTLSEDGAPDLAMQDIEARPGPGCELPIPARVHEKQGT